jgi:hypothetical protein
MNEMTLMKEHRLRVFEKRVLREIFGPMRDEVIDRFRNLTLIDGW